MKTTIIVEVGSSNPDVDSTPDYLGIALDEELARHLLRRIRTVQALKAHDLQLWEMVFWDYLEPFWFEQEERDPEEGITGVFTYDSEEEDGPFDPRPAQYRVTAIVPGELECPDLCARRVECILLCVDDSSVHWRAIYRNTGVRLESDDLSVALLESFLTP